MEPPVPVSLDHALLHVLHVQLGFLFGVLRLLQVFSPLTGPV